MSIDACLGGGGMLSCEYSCHSLHAFSPDPSRSNQSLENTLESVLSNGSQSLRCTCEAVVIHVVPCFFFFASPEFAVNCAVPAKFLRINQTWGKDDKSAGISAGLWIPVPFHSPASTARMCSSPRCLQAPGRFTE